MDFNNQDTKIRHVSPGLGTKIMVPKHERFSEDLPDSCSMKSGYSTFVTPKR